MADLPACYVSLPEGFFQQWEMTVLNDGGMTEPSFKISDSHLLGGTFESPRFTKGGLWEVHRWSCKNAIWPYFLSKLPCWFVWELFFPQNCWWLNCLLGRKLACKFHEKQITGGDKRRDRQSTRETIPLSFPSSFLWDQTNRCTPICTAMSCMPWVPWLWFFFSEWSRVVVEIKDVNSHSKWLHNRKFQILWLVSTIWFFAYFGYINALFISFVFGGHPFS